MGADSQDGALDPRFAFLKSYGIGLPRLGVWGNDPSNLDDTKF